MNMSKISQAMLEEMDGMSEAEFQASIGLSKAAFVAEVETAARAEVRATTEEGKPAPDFVGHLMLEDGGVSPELFRLADLKGQSVSLIFGCYTCPVFRRQTERMQQLIAKFEGQIASVFVYVLETHPTDGWNTSSNEAANIMYAQPATLDDRAAIARDWRDAFDIQAPIVLDWPDNRINDDYAGTPERLYVLDAEGVVTFKSEPGPYYDDHLEDWAAALARVAGD